MNTIKTSVAPLKKVHVEITLSVGSADSTGASGEVRTLAFIYGLGSSGLSPFEFHLAQAGTGDTVQLEVDPEQWDSYFGLLHLTWPESLPQHAKRRIQVQVQAVNTPPQREIIQALAESTACGSGCCGDH